MWWKSVLLTGMLSGCALLPPAPAVLPAQPESASFGLNGRILVNYQGARQSARLLWTHTAKTDDILLLAPLGQTAARVHRDAQKATLDDGNKHYQADNAETLMQQVLGWYLPLSVLHHWVLGLAATDSPSQIERDGNGQIAVLHQNGWEIRYLRYAAASNAPEADNLPTRLQLSRNGLQMQLLIDGWELP